MLKENAKILSITQRDFFELNSSIVCEVNRTVFFFYKTYFKPKIHKTITTNNQPNIFCKQKKLTNNQPNILYKQKAFNQDNNI